MVRVQALVIRSVADIPRHLLVPGNHFMLPDGTIYQYRGDPGGEGLSGIGDVFKKIGMAGAIVGANFIPGVGQVASAGLAAGFSALEQNSQQKRAQGAQLLATLEQADTQLSSAIVSVERQLDAGQMAPAQAAAAAQDILAQWNQIKGQFTGQYAANVNNSLTGAAARIVSKAQAKMPSPQATASGQTAAGQTTAADSTVNVAGLSISTNTLLLGAGAFLLWKAMR